jgi:hypothetical protein
MYQSREGRPGLCELCCGRLKAKAHGQGPAGGRVPAHQTGPVRVSGFPCDDTPMILGCMILIRLKAKAQSEGVLSRTAAHRAGPVRACQASSETIR